MKTLILAKNGIVCLPAPSGERKISKNVLATLGANLISYGYILSKEAFDKLQNLSKVQAQEFWADLEPALKSITGDDKNMDRFVVYKNFPQEVLDKTSAEYWIAQIFMYLGVPNEIFTQEELPRDKMLEDTKLKVLHLGNNNSLQKILDALLALPSRWTKDQLNDVKFIVYQDEIVFDAATIPFKENMVKLVAYLIDKNVDVNIRSATDVLRLAVGLSDGDVSLRSNTKFRKFSRKERRFLLGLLDKTSNLGEDLARRKEVWKRLFKGLHPSDYPQFENVIRQYNDLYNNNLRTFNSLIEKCIQARNKDAIFLLQSRAGEYARRLFKIVEVFGQDGVDGFLSVLKKLKTVQLLIILKQVETINSRTFRTFAPKGNWSRLQVVENKIHLDASYQSQLTNLIREEIAGRVQDKYKTVYLSEEADWVKLQTNDSDLTPYGRGTVFPVPENIKFVRSASYWKNKTYGNNWFDNGWNFFDEGWNPCGACCWTSETFMNKSAVFAGDPTNSKDSEGRACQVIDLYLDKLEQRGVRYAVWNVLCYSGIKFSEANEVFAALQWGEEAAKGKIFEASRVQLAFPLTGDCLTKYIAYIDIKERKLIYIDANLKGNVNSAERNESTLSEVMPAYVEYLDTLPSVYDLFKGVRKHKKGLPVLYTDKDVEFDNKNAFVFSPENDENNFEQINVAELLNV